MWFLLIASKTHEGASFYIYNGIQTRKAVKHADWFSFLTWMRDYFNADSFHSYEEGKMTIGKKDRIEPKACPRNIWKECRFQPPSIDIDGSEEKSILWPWPAKDHCHLTNWIWTNISPIGATFLLVDCDGSVVFLIIVLLKSIAFRRNTSCLFTLVVLCIVSTIAPIMATNKIRLGTKNQTE